MTLAVFGYGSLASPASAELSLGRAVEPAAVVRLRGWRRRWTVFRDNLASEKTFALADGTVPPYVVGLSIERDPGCEGANGVLIEIGEAEADRLDLREMRYRRIEAVDDVVATPGTAEPAFDSVIAYEAKPEHHAPTAPPGAIVIARYVRTVEAAFADLGPGELERFRATTDPPPVEPVEATLVADEIPPGNPRAW
ncbi:MAG: gamma-glutamylcyclotransferase family protein [Solirubrobacterales bacterium]